jgi:hypothetical protein
MTALAATEEWVPGDPLYAYPYGGDDQYVRELFSVLPDDWIAVHHFCNGYSSWAKGMARCIPCLVAWDPDDGGECWNCGKPAAGGTGAYA